MKHINYFKNCKKHLDPFTTLKDADFREDGILNLPQRWRNLVKQDDTYVIIHIFPTND